eukprot:TRINITY_DN846_c0_g1_i1.p1 TRINITY_DN846_c0_g1~~TRINITY_DN846_c0_g1_i1.p1  ORF type:complete len:130 (-),score=56.59 TRINITY_DN846_c0_g1_i1:73-462(-)
MDVKFLAPLNELFHTLLDAQRISAFTQSQSIIKPEKNFEYSLLSGAITGRILDIEPNSKIIKTWRFSSWPTGHFSQVTMNFVQESNGITLKFEQTNIPIEDFERTKSGWSNNFFDRIKMIFGWGNFGIA